MTDLSQAPATEPVEEVVLPATEGGKGEIAGQIRDALETPEGSTQDNSPREVMRRQIGDALAKETGEGEQPAEVAAKPERARGADGRFIPTPQEAAAGIDPNDAPVAEPVQPNGPPSSWSKDMQARWGELPPEFQAIISKREADVAKGFEKYQNLRAVEPVLDFAENLGKQLGIPGQRIVHQWAQIQEGLLDPNKRGAILSQAAKNYGIEHASPEVMGFAAQVAPRLGTTPSNLIAQWATFQNAVMNPATRKQAYDFLAKAYPVDGTQQQTQTDPNQWVDPDVADLKQRLAQFEGWQQQLVQQAQHYEQQQMYQVQQAKVSAIDQFTSEKGADGQPLRPHLETVWPDMVAVIPRIKSTNPQISDQEALQQAYDSAVWGNPTTRAQVLQAQKAADEKDRNAQARARAQAASRGAVSPAGVSPQGPPAAQPLKGDIRSQMHEAFAQLTS